MSHKSKNPFAILATDSDSEVEVVSSPPSSPPFRVWHTTEIKNPFNSPFKGKSHSHPKKEEGWVSIRKWSHPQFVEEEEGGLSSVGAQPHPPLTPTGETEIFPEARVVSSCSAESEMREIVLECVTATATYRLSEETDVPKQESMTAVAWAERIKKSLEKAEVSRAEKAKRVDPEEFKEALGRLSFFRRTLAVEEKN